MPPMVKDRDFVDERCFDRQCDDGKEQERDDREQTGRFPLRDSRCHRLAVPPLAHRCKTSTADVESIERAPQRTERISARKPMVTATAYESHRSSRGEEAEIA